MKKVIIWGAGVKGKNLFHMIKEGKIEQLKQYKVECFCDNGHVSGSFTEGVKVVHPLELLEIEKYDILISTSNIVDEVMLQLKQLKVANKVFYIADYVYKYKWNDNNMPFMIEMDINKPRLNYLECKIASKCNLNCNGCSVAANINEKWFMESRKFEKDLIALKKLYTGIKYFKLFGGEPLLNSEIDCLLELSRKYFPDSQIVVHSNGLLVPSMSEKFFNIMNKYEIAFVFTLYPETGKKMRVIKQILDSHDISYEFTKPTYEFRKCINLKGDYDPVQIYSNCCKCINLIDGTLSCGLGQLIEIIEKRFNTQICENKYENCIDIYNTDLDGWEINRRLDTPNNLCAYCAFMRFNVNDNEDYFYEWKSEQPKLEDWCFK